MQQLNIYMLQSFTIRVLQYQQEFSYYTKQNPFFYKSLASPIDLYAFVSEPKQIR